MSIKIKSLVAAVALVGAGLVGAQTASAATAAPTVKLAQPTFTDLQDASEPGVVSYPIAWGADFVLHWTVSAPAGVCAQSITYSDYNTFPGSQTDAIVKTARSYSVGADFYDWMRGGYDAVIHVTDCKGVKVSSNAVNVVLQPGDDSDSAMSYSHNGGWALAHCTCFLGGTSTYTSTKNANIVFTTPRPNDASGVVLALIMPKGPGRGSAALYIDNKYKATINTNAATNINGTIVYQTLLPGTAIHLVKIVNLATPGHPRIDLDATINGG